uniref:Haloacid dehalogenase-like hydrolase n=1 Tax=mine drainage metagenome TaxID=410659 RepID=E6QK39_9ZZZZ
MVCYERLTESSADAMTLGKIRSFARSIADQEIELMPGVRDLLPELASRHRLILMTKGDQAEQADKLARSGVAQHFQAVEIVAEKNAAAYHAVAERHGCERSATWMVGNSPKSDINPALAAGLHAVFVVHQDTWVLEHAELHAPPAGQRLIEIESFAQLAEIF